MSRQQQSIITKKKFTSQGNRRLRRFECKCHAKGLENDTIRELVFNHSSPVKSTGQIIEEKDKVMTDVLTSNRKIDFEREATPVNQVPSSSKYQCIEGDWSSIMKNKSRNRQNIPKNNFNRYKTQNSTLSIDHWKQSAFLTPKYQKMGRSCLTQSLANAMPHYRHAIMTWLADSKVFNFVKQHIHNTALIYQNEIELNYWNSVIDAAEPMLTLLSTESRRFTRENYIHWDYPQTKQNIQHRQQLIRNKLNQCKTQLNNRKNNQSHIGITKETMDIIRQASTSMIQADYRKFSVKLNEKLTLLEYDIHDIQLVKSFYDLLPNQQQIDIVKHLWRLKFKANKRMTKQNHIDTQDNKTKDWNAAVYQDPSVRLSHEIHTASMRNIVYARLRNMDKRNAQIFHFQQ